MKVHLMYRDADFNMEGDLPVNEKELLQDLELTTLFDAMANGDELLFEVAKRAILSGLTDPEAIEYRQDILRDCLKNPSVVRELYAISLESVENKRKRWLGIFSRYPSAILDGSIRMLQMFVELLRKLKAIADENVEKFESDGFRTFFAMIRSELDDEYFATVQRHLKRLRFSDGVLVSARLGKGNEGTDYVLRRPNEDSKSWIKRVVSRKPPSYSFYINPRDEHGAMALSELRDRGINLVANAVAQSADHIDSFFEMMRVELAFYVGCLNLYEKLSSIGASVCFPTPSVSGERVHSFDGLYDVSLALTMGRQVVGNDINANGKKLCIITGANQGGKSTFLRSIGLSQLMMQSGMFVGARSFSANVCEGLFTHYRREEDTTMESGKLDEELKRMSDIVDNITPNSMILFNESFAATNEREGSEIARQIVNALLDRGIKVFFVTHLYEFAHSFSNRGMGDAIFLRAERKKDGTRTFKLIEAEPLSTSYGEDLYEKIFVAKN